jgi:hypothetical protein
LWGWSREAILGGELVVGNVSFIRKAAWHFFLWVHLKIPIYETREEAEEDQVATILAMYVIIPNKPCIFKRLFWNTVFCCSAYNESGDRHLEWLL